MAKQNLQILCRICLEESGIFPIFERTEDTDDVSSKLCFCLNEKIEDIEGYPRYMCKLCHEALIKACDFIRKYKESNEILSKTIVIVKVENTEYNDDCGINESEESVDCENIKTEINVADNLQPIIKLTPLKISVEKVKVEKIKICQAKNKTNRIASSILEGDFVWTGEKWSLKGSNTNTKSRETILQQAKLSKKRRRDFVIKRPKEKRSPPPKLCDLCGEVFKTQDKLTVHKKKTHFNKPSRCPKCPRVCNSKYNLDRHLKRRHNVEKNFICSSCGRGFAFKGELSSHYKNVHEKHLKPKKVYMCKICNKTYKCAKSVLVHERSVHTGIRPAVCNVCGNSFYHEDYLKEHMRLHTGETPFKCPVCERGYAQRGNMKSHLRIHKISEVDPGVLLKMRPNYIKLLKS